MRAAAFFDVDGTLLRGNVVGYYARLRTLDMSRFERGLWLAGFVLTVPWWLVLDKCSRGLFQREFYKNYARIAPAALESRARAHFDRYMAPRLYPGALQRIREHQERQDLVVLVTGSLRPIVEPLAARARADELIAPELRVENGVFTG